MADQPSPARERPAARPGRLPPGRHTLHPEFVAANQRERLLAAFAELVAERGYNATTIATIAALAGVSRRTFYANFTDKEACYLAAFDLFADHLTAAVAASDDPDAAWPQRLIATISTLLRELSAAPDFASLCLVEATAAGPAVAIRYRETLLGLLATLRPGRALRGAENPISAGAEEALIGGAVALISARIRAGEADRLPDLMPDLVEFILSPYIGGAEAGRIARQLPQAP